MKLMLLLTAAAAGAAAGYMLRERGGPDVMDKAKHAFGNTADDAKHEIRSYAEEVRSAAGDAAREAENMTDQRTSEYAQQHGAYSA